MANVSDTLIVALSDLHSGGSTALFPARFWQFQHVNHTPTEQQKKMHDHWTHCIGVIKEARKRKRLIIVHDGDAIDGVHHSTPQIITRNKNEQCEIHCELMDEFMQGVGFKKGDQLYYVKGTEVHVNDAENIIGEDLNAIKCGDFFAFDFLDIEVNGRELWFSHHGPSSGKGANKGNALRNNLRNLYYDCDAEGRAAPDMLVTAHTHDPMLEILPRWQVDRLHMLYGIILPSWQRKTRFAYKVAPTQKNRIGLAWWKITASGEIIVKNGGPFELLKETRMPRKA